MRAKEIEVGREYAAQSGKYDVPRRVVVREKDVAHSRREPRYGFTRTVSGGLTVEIVLSDDPHNRGVGWLGRRVASTDVAAAAARLGLDKVLVRIITAREIVEPWEVKAARDDENLRRSKEAAAARAVAAEQAEAERKARVAVEEERGAVARREREAVLAPYLDAYPNDPVLLRIRDSDSTYGVTWREVLALVDKAEARRTEERG